MQHVQHDRVQHHAELEWGGQRGSLSIVQRVRREFRHSWLFVCACKIHVPGDTFLLSGCPKEGDMALIDLFRVDVYGYLNSLTIHDSQDVFAFPEETFNVRTSFCKPQNPEYAHRKLCKNLIATPRQYKNCLYASPEIPTVRILYANPKTQV